jgi:hypothetical protein
MKCGKNGQESDAQTNGQISFRAHLVTRGTSRRRTSSSS